MAQDRPELDPKDRAIKELLYKLNEAESAINTDSDWLTLDEVKARLQI